jgi:sugar/nucleoside kinase (ribokinase family)
MAEGVLCTGNLVVDLLVRPVEEIPWGRTAMVDAIEQHTGGNGANTAMAIGTLGTRVRLLGAVGEDAFGDWVAAALARAGVDASGLLRSASAPTAVTAVMVHADGRRGFLHRLGASGEWAIEIEAFDRHLADGFAHYHVASPFGLPRMRGLHAGLLRRAREAGLSTSIDTQWDSRGGWLEDLAPCLPYTDCLFANEDEARMLSGTEDAAATARLLRGLGARTAVIKLGARGCLIATDAGETAVPAYEVDVVDTTGAGDCFVGAFLSERLRGAPLADCARFAAAVAAMTIGKLGATAGLGPRSEVEEWRKERASTGNSSPSA